MKCNWLRIMMALGLILSILSFQVAYAQVVKVATADFPPYSYRDNNQQVGIGTEIIRAIYKELNLELKVTQYPWKRAYMTVSEEQNVLLYPMARRPKRENLFHWIGKIAPREIYFFKLKLRQDIKIKTFDDIKKYKVAVVRGYSSTQDLINKGLKKSVYEVAHEHQAFLMLKAGRVDLILNDDLVLAYGIQNFNKTASAFDRFSFSSLEKAFLLSTGGGRYIVMSKSTSEDVVKKYKNAFKKIEKNGVIQKIISKYLK